MATLPQESPRAAVGFCLERGWRLLWLVADGPGGKFPPPNCDGCRARPRAVHDPEACPCLTCHSFYAATDDLSRLRAAYAALGDARGRHLAVRTGAASRLLVVDAEAHARPGEPDGLEVLDRWEEATGGAAGPLPATLAARTVSGGTHLYYRTPAGWEAGSGRVLPGVDVKSAGGYVGAPGWDGARSWVDPAVPVADAPPALCAWAGTTRRRGTGGRPGAGGPPAGYDFRRFVAEGCPDGHRDHFMNDLLFRARSRGAGAAELAELARHHWRRAAQPPDAVHEMPWRHVEYKVRRVLTEVEPVVVTGARAAWAARLAAAAGAGDVVRTGRVTLARPAGTVR